MVTLYLPLPPPPPPPSVWFHSTIPLQHMYMYLSVSCTYKGKYTHVHISQCTKSTAWKQTPAARLQQTRGHNTSITHVANRPASLHEFCFVDRASDIVCFPLPAQTLFCLQRHHSATNQIARSFSNESQYGSSRTSLSSQ